MPPTTSLWPSEFDWGWFWLVLVHAIVVKPVASGMVALSAAAPDSLPPLSAAVTLLK